MRNLKKIYDRDNFTIIDVESIEGDFIVDRWRKMAEMIEKVSDSLEWEQSLGRPDLIICSPDVAAALMAIGGLDYSRLSESFSTFREYEEFSGLFVGTAFKQYEVYIDPNANENFITIGYAEDVVKYLQ